MFFLAARKMIHRKGLTACLLLGCILASAILCSVPLYTDGVLQRLMVKDFEAYEQTWSSNPALLTLSHQLEYQVDTGYEAYVQERDFFTKSRMEQTGMQLWDSSELLVVDGLRFQRVDADSRRHTPVALYGMSGYDKWVKLTAGRLPEPGRQEDGTYEVLIQAKAQTSLNVGVGSEYVVRDYGGFLKEPVIIRIVGLFEQSDGGNMWDYTAYTDMFLMDYETLRSDFVDHYQVLTQAAWVYSLDYTSLRMDQVSRAFDAVADLTESFCVPYEKTLTFPAQEILSAYILREQQLRTMLWGIQVPILMMLGFYLFMVAQLIVRSDAAEVALIASRGGGMRQVLAMYGYQSLLLAGSALVAGPPLSWFICSFLGAMTGFCDFAHRTALPILLRPRTLLYALAAFAGTVLLLMIPVIRTASSSIVTVKQTRSSRWKAPLWQKLFLDVIFLAASLYGLHSYSLRQDAVVSTAASGLEVPIDPVLFLISTLFLLGSALLFVRLWPFVVRLVYHIGRKFWNAPLYSAFTNTMRGGSRERFLALFLILTFAIGIYGANTAATLNGNMFSRVRYDLPVDAVMTTRWLQPADAPSVTQFGGSGFVETDFDKVIAIDGVVDGARVHLRDQMISRILSQTVSTVGQKIEGTIMTFEPREFSRVLRAQEGLMDHSVYEYLQLMDKYQTGIVVSSAYRDEYGLSIGDTLSYWIKDDDGIIWGEVEGQILAFADFWPGINPATDSGKFFILAHYDYWKLHNLLMPYEYWLSLEEGVDREAFMQAAESNPYADITSLRLFSEELRRGQNDPLLEGANGALTLGFVMTVTAAFTGFLLHWYMTTRSRELQFGILRAMGLPLSGLMGMIASEQLLTCLSAALAGVFIGGIASDLYIPMMQMVESAMEQCPPYQVYARVIDYGRIYACMFSLFASGFVMLSLLMSRMKVTHALKLGED